MELQTIAEEARQYCESVQNREFELDGACHENVIGAGDYVRYNTSYHPIIVWGVLSHRPESETADSIHTVSEMKTHFWLEISDDIETEQTKDGIIDVYTNNPLAGDTSQYVDSGIAYGGQKPDCYNTVEKIEYFGRLRPYDLAHKDNFEWAVTSTL